MTTVALSLFALLGTLATLPTLIRWLDRRQLMDVPGERTSHDRPTPRGGGAALVAPFIVAWAIGSEFGWEALLASIVGLAGFAALGFRDDLGDLGVRIRLVLQVVLGVALTASVSPDAVWLLPGAIFVVAVVNAFNFMDGINGISGMTLVVAGLAYAALGATSDESDLALLGLCAAAAGAGFLPFNIPSARVFLGDVGSYFGGAVLAFLALLAMSRGLGIVAAAAPLAIYGADTSLTLLRRIRRGDTWHEAHREHSYQQLSDVLGSHVRTSIVVGVATIAVSIAGLLSTADASVAPVVSALVIVSVAWMYTRTPHWMST